MRIVHYYPWALKGDFGTAIAVRGWGEASAEAGDDVTLVTGTRDEKALPPGGVHLVRLPLTPGDVPRPGMLAPHVRGADLFVVHGGWDVRNVIAARDADRVGVPYMVVPHGAYYPQVFARRHRARKAVWWTTVERRYLERAAAIHVFFDPEIDHLRSRGVASPFVVAPNGHDAPPGVRWHPDDQMPYLAWLGRYDVEHKGIDLLIRAVASMPPAERPRIELVGVDWNGGRRIVEDLVAKLGVGDHISVGPPRYGEDKWRLLTRSSGFVYPSRWDASPMAVVEATSIGVPTLTGPINVGRFLADRGGAVCVGSSPDAIAEGLRRLRSPQAAELARRGAEVSRDELSWASVARSWRRQVALVLEPSTIV